MIKKPNRAMLASIFQRVAVTQEAFAKKLATHAGVDCSQQTVQQWLKRENVPPEWVTRIVRASEGEVYAYEIRPDVFPVPD